MLTKSDLKNLNLITKDCLKKELRPIKADLRKIRKDINTVIDFFDREYLNLQKRVARTEEHLGLSPL